MSVVTSFEEVGPCRKRLTIEVPAPAVQAETGRIVQDLSRNIQLPGFRRGKVPAKIVQKRFSEEIRQQVIEKLVPRYWNQAEAEKSLDPISQPEIEDIEMEPGEPMTFAVIVETRPEIVLGDLEDFELPESETEPSDEDIEEALLNLRRQLAEWKSVDRAAAQGDRVIGTAFDTEAEAAAEGEDADPERPLSAPFNVELGGPGIDEQLTLALTGRAAGQEAVYEREGGEDGPAIKHRLEIAEVQEIELPEADDELAKKVSDFETFEELRDAMAGRLRHDKEHRAFEEKERALLEQLRERHPLELPQGAVESELQRLMQDQAMRMAQQGVDVQRDDFNWEAIHESLKPIAERRVHEQLLLDAVAADRELKVDEQRFEYFLASFAAQQKKSSLALRQEMGRDGRLQEMRQQLLRQQTIRHLMGEDEEAEDVNEDSETASEDADT